MSPATIINRAQADGVRLTLSAGTIKATGDGAAVNRWLTVIRKHKAEIIDVLKVGAGGTATSTWWRLRYPDRDPVEVSCTPPATHAEILERHPDAVAAEPFTPATRQPSAPLTAEEETAIRAWLALIGETDPATIAEVIGQCQLDAGARDYFTRRAAAELPSPLPDDRHNQMWKIPQLIRQNCRHHCLMIDTLVESVGTCAARSALLPDPTPARWWWQIEVTDQQLSTPRTDARGFREVQHD